jgi:two-component system, cell cycle sensor histidine kinase and response regulator CckA
MLGPTTTGWTQLKGNYGREMSEDSVKVLVIDDERMIRTLAEKILVRAGYEVILAETGNEGVDLFRQQPNKIDLLIVDMTMDGLSGEETLRACRVIHPYIPAVFSSGQFLDETDIPEDLALNTYYLQKPYRASALVEKIEEVVAATEPAE